MSLRADIGNQCKGGSIEKCVSNPLKEPDEEKRPKREGHEVAGGSEPKEEGTEDHHFFLGSSQKELTGERSEDQ
jgi:hypothetical protein